MKIKEGANIQGLDIRMRPVLIAADMVWQNHGHELCVTAGLDGEHSAGSLHYFGLAVDLRTRYFYVTERREVAADLRASLNSNYDVVLHRSHIHVEFDPK